MSKIGYYWCRKGSQECSYVVVNYHSCLLECSLNVYSVLLNCRPLGDGSVRTFVAELEEGAVSACDRGW